MFEAVKKVFKNKDVMKKIGFTLLAYFIFTVLTRVTVPLVNSSALSSSFDNTGFLGIVNSISGNALKQYSIIALGITPYITASIITQINHEFINKGVKFVIQVGDITDWGLESEYKEALKYIGSIKKRTFIVPGNHDARIAGYKMFQRLFCKGYERYFSRSIGNVLLIGLDSSEPDIDDGHIGREQLGWLEEQLKGFSLFKHIIYPFRPE